MLGCAWSYEPSLLGSKITSAFFHAITFPTNLIHSIFIWLLTSSFWRCRTLHGVCARLVIGCQSPWLLDWKRNNLYVMGMIKKPSIRTSELGHYKLRIWQVRDGSHGRKLDLHGCKIGWNIGAEEVSMHVINLKNREGRVGTCRDDMLRYHCWHSWK